MARRDDEIDTEAMRERVRSRHLGPSSRRARGDFGGDLVAVAGIESVIAWCKRRGVKVRHARQPSMGLWQSDTRTITIESRLSPVTQLHILLHECGHMLIDSSRSHSTEVKYGDAYVKEAAARKTVDKVNIVAEEFEAWHRGWLLAERLGLHISKREYDAQRTRAVKTYMEWALSLKRQL